MNEVLTQSPLLPRHTRIKKKKEKYLFLNPDKPSWVVTNANGAVALHLCNGTRTVGDICRIISQKMGSDKTPEITEFFRLLILEKHFFSDPEPHQYTGAGLQAVHLNLTNKCNLQCIYCYAGDRAPSEDALSREDWFSLIESINTIGSRTTIELTGGEPLLVPYAIDLAAFARQRGNRVHLLTNGLLIDRETAAAMKENVDLVRISLDGSTPAIHDYHRGAGSFAAASRAVDLLISAGAPVQVSMTVTQKNLHDIAQMAARFGSLVSFAPLFRTPRVRGLRSLWITGRAYYRALLSVPGLNPLNCLYSCLQQASSARIIKCSIGDAEISIANTGDVYPCHLLHLPAFLAGNIKHQPLDAIYRNSDRLQALRSLNVDRIKGCSVCDIRYICGGACRARSFYEKSRIDVADDFCAYEKLAFTEGLFELHSLD
jgi:radical SAM protein with 4Fe4S-binding SPASM domain